MGTDIRPECSKKNKYYISKHRYYELKHFCLQYKEWKSEYSILSLNLSASSGMIFVDKDDSNIPDRTGDTALRMAELSRKISLIETVCKAADNLLWSYILKGVTEGLGYTGLYGIPCSPDTYYDRYRKFFWLLDKTK